MSSSFSEEELETFFVGAPESIGHVRERFSPFEYFRPGEVDLSRIMADLLNPEGSHRCADRFLLSFLACISETRFGDAMKAATVRLNDPTEDGRLIDITVSSDQFILGIENKPWAREGRKQVTDYLQDLRRKKTANGYKLLYLSGDGSSPPSLKPEEEEVRI
ncbi:MAG: PD-(D/E)XK nuclease family protein [Candidatus Sulfotelmatobacter sp.]